MTSTKIEDAYTTESDGRFSGTTLNSVKFRQSTHLIPSPGSSGKLPKRYEPLILTLPMLLGIPLVLLALGLGLEIATWISNKNNGFRVPTSNVFDIFGDVSAQFLASFFPTLLVIPNAILWRELDWMTRWYQPYLVLQKGNAKAEESLLLDYIALGPVLALFRAMNYKHRLVFWSSLTACLTYFFQPLTGSIFQIRTIPQIDPLAVTNTKIIGLSSDISTLDAFLGAAGYVDASVIHNLTDPHSSKEGGQLLNLLFFPSKDYLNGTLTLTTAGVQTKANCSNPVSTTLTPLTTNSFNLTSTSIDGCVHSLIFNSTGQQNGVDAVPCPGDAASLDPSLQPVMFWYFNQRVADNQPEAKTVFCTPQLAAAQVLVKANLATKTLLPVTGLGDLPNGNLNTVFGPPQLGRPFNGLIFSNITTQLDQARADTTRSMIPAAAFRAATQLPDGLQSTFDFVNGFLDLTSKLYTRHLAIGAKSLFFVSPPSALVPLQGEVESLVPRLKIDPLPAHILACILIFTGIGGISIQVILRNKRKKLLLAAPPGSIAAVVALTARSGFGELLLPYDDELTLERKLDGLRFRLDRRTGAILAEEDDGAAYGVALGRDDAMLSLLGKRFGKGKKSKRGAKGSDEDADLDPEASSSYLAYQAAVGTLPWSKSWEPSSSQPLLGPLTTPFTPTTPSHPPQSHSAEPSRTEYVP
ncbi:unnamed protein product [Cyclocybe aegerita]|uniref:Uncharacterized protein n=1 Tax=Cyclocybe aegerita TaxID=1973307 RepID=A0A8S0WDV9_CYCAE|nr:unnamed protein product [Cyclocybe aegerita]